LRATGWVEKSVVYAVEHVFGGEGGGWGLLVRIAGGVEWFRHATCVVENPALGHFR
jgi:hypothetical protein